MTESTPTPDDLSQPPDIETEHWTRHETTIRSAIVILAGGAGRRMSDPLAYTRTNPVASHPAADRPTKTLLGLAGIPVIVWSLRAALSLPHVQQLVVVVREEDRNAMQQVLAEHLPDASVHLVTGGATRHASETAALRYLTDPIRSGEIDVVVVHDGARPLALPRLFTTVIRTAYRHGGAVPAVALGARVGESLPLVRVQTPQAFRARKILAAYTDAARNGYDGADTSACMLRYSDLPIHTVPGTYTNIKITVAKDLGTAEYLVAANARAAQFAASASTDPTTNLEPVPPTSVAPPVSKNPAGHETSEEPPPGAIPWDFEPERSESPPEDPTETINSGPTSTHNVPQWYPADSRPTSGTEINERAPTAEPVTEPLAHITTGPDPTNPRFPAPALMDSDREPQPRSEWKIRRRSLGVNLLTEPTPPGNQSAQ